MLVIEQALSQLTPVERPSFVGVISGNAHEASLEERGLQMSVAGTVDGIWRYPVSSLGGEPLAGAEVGASGIRGDRCLGLVDRQTGEIAAPEKQKRWRPAASIEARWSAREEVEVAVPSGLWLPAISYGGTWVMTV